MQTGAAQAQPAAGDADATRRRQSLQWGDADEGSGFPGRMPEHDAEDDYEELLQVGEFNKGEKWGYADTLGAGPAIEIAAMAMMSASVVSSLHDGRPLGSLRPTTAVDQIGVREPQAAWESLDPDMRSRKALLTSQSGKGVRACIEHPIAVSAP